MQRFQVLFLCALPLLLAPSAEASTSVTLSLETVVDHATSVALVEPREASSRWEDGRIVTYTHMHVVESVAGAQLQEPWVRTLGGSVGDVGQIVEGEADMRVRSVVFLRKEGESMVVVGRAQGQYLAPTENGARVLRAPTFAGKLVQARTSSGALLRAFPLAGSTYTEASRTIRALWEVRHAAR